MQRKFDPQEDIKELKIEAAKLGFDVKKFESVTETHKGLVFDYF